MRDVVDPELGINVVDLGPTPPWGPEHITDDGASSSALSVSPPDRMPAGSQL